MSDGVRILLTVLAFLASWFGGYIVLSLPAVLLDEWSGLRLEYRPGMVNLFTLTLALAALPAALLAWLVPQWLSSRDRRPS